MTKKLTYNPTDTPVVIDDDGRTVGGGEFAALDGTSEPVKAALADGRLVCPAKSSDDVSPDAAAVLDGITEPAPKKSKE